MIGQTGALRLPIFPLSTVLFPNGVLPLRIFEARYMDMIRACLRQETPFGVCLITNGKETGQPAEHVQVGCSANVGQWDMEHLGVLNIRAVGVQRFRVLTTRLQPDGLITAQVQYLDREPDCPIPDEFDRCVGLLKKIVVDLVEKEPDSLHQMIERPFDFESCSWVSNRLCEFLPIPSMTKQRLMELDDPLARLTVEMDFLSKQGIV